MNKSIGDLYKYALLAKAAYGNLKTGNLIDQLTNASLFLEFPFVGGKEQANDLAGILGSRLVFCISMIYFSNI